MNTPLPATARQIRSLLTAEGELIVSLRRAPMPTPKDDEVLIRVEATPINPSDLGLLFGAADLSALKSVGSADEPAVSAPMPAPAMKALAARIGDAALVGNEGAGTVVAAGSSPQAQALLGKTVAAIPGGMYSEYAVAKAAVCVPLPAGVTPAQGASIFVNPLTALGMVETMRRGGHKAIVHTAAASNLGQMLNRVCLKDGIGLVNVVRSEAQEKLLREQGATHVCNSSAENFAADLTEQIAATGATVAFDAIGGGGLASQILSSMETALARAGTGYSRYGSTTLKQVYIYGALDMGPTVLKRNFGFAFSISGWLLFPFLESIGTDAARGLQMRVLSELGSTFASHYAREITLAEMLQPEVISVYTQRTTGAKYLVTPAR